MPSPYFVTTDFIDAGGENYMSWDQLRELSSSGVVIGTLGASYRHLVSLNESEVAADIAQANQRFMDKIGVMPELFAYPFGEYSADLQKIITRYRYSVAFGQHSSVMYPGAGSASNC